MPEHHGVECSQPNVLFSLSKLVENNTVCWEKVVDVCMVCFIGSSVDGVCICCSREQDTSLGLDQFCGSGNSYSHKSLGGSTELILS